MGDEDPGDSIVDGGLEVLGEAATASSQAKVRSTTHRRGKSTKPLAVSERLMISKGPVAERGHGAAQLMPA